MHKKLQNRRDIWLKLSSIEIGYIRDRHWTYMSTETENYAKIKFSETRMKELECQSSHRLSKLVKCILYGILTVLGSTIFSTLPGIIIGSLDANDFIVSIGKLLVGIILVFTAHLCISLFIKGMLLFQQYETMREKLDDDITGISKETLNYIFLSTKIRLHKDQEKSQCKLPDPFITAMSVIFTLLEMFAVYTVLVEQSLLLICTAMLLPLCLLWGISYITAFYEEIPQEYKKIRTSYFNERKEIESSYVDYHWY
jgi:hypothetical protein